MHNIPHGSTPNPKKNLNRQPPIPPKNRIRNIIPQHVLFLPPHHHQRRATYVRRPSRPKHTQYIPRRHPPIYFILHARRCARSMPCPVTEHYQLTYRFQPDRHASRGRPDLKRAELAKSVQECSSKMAKAVQRFNVRVNHADDVRIPDSHSCG